MAHSFPVQAALDLAARTESIAGRASSKHTKAMADQANRIALSLKALDEMARTRNPSDTMDAHILKLSAAAKRMQSSVEQVRGHFNNILTEGLRDLYGRITEKTGINSSVDTLRGAEIRAYVRSLPATERGTLMMKAMESNDRETLTAILAAPDYLSGLDGKMKSDLFESYQAKVAPELVAELKLLREADEAALVLANTASSAIDKAVDPINMARILEQQAKADAVNNTFNSTILDA